jgi:hypothetical protein
MDQLLYTVDRLRATRMPIGVAGERPVKAVPYADACDFGGL